MARTFGELGRYRRLHRDSERQRQTGETMVCVAMIQLMLTRLTKDRGVFKHASSEKGIDLPEPKLSVTPDNRLMLLMGGSVYEGTKLTGRWPRVVGCSPSADR